MEKLTPIQKIDAVLFIFDPNSAYRGIHKIKIKDILNEKGVDISDRLLIEVLNKLVKDDHLRIEVSTGVIKGKSYDDVQYYLLTFEGELFQLNGGYVGESIAEGARQHWEDALLIKGEKNGERLNKLTLVLSIGTIALALVEIIKLFSCK